MKRKKSNGKKVLAACLATCQLASITLPVSAADQLQNLKTVIAQKSNVDPGFSYGAKSVDYVAGEDYYSLENQYVKTLIGSTKAKNDQKGPMSNGAIMDAVSKTSNRENLDWTQFVLSSEMNASWNTAGTKKVLDLNEIEVKGNTIVASGNYLANPDIKGEVVYSLVENTPLIKMEVKLTNEGAEDFKGYFEYLTDPDESNEDDTYVPGVGWTTSNSSSVLTNHEWTENYIFEGSKTNYSGYTAHAILWDEANTTPTGLVNDSYIFGAWFDASVAAGESKTLTFYHLPHDPGGVNKPYSEAEFWAKVVRGEADVDNYGIVEGTVTDRNGNPVKNVDITCEYTYGEKTAGTAVTDENGHYSIRVEKDVYTLTATIPGYAQSSQSVDLNTQGNNPKADMILDTLAGTRITQDTSMLSFGGLVEGKTGDYTIENEMFTMSVANETQDGQLKDSSAARILDIAFNGRQDAMDWLFTSWISDVKPHQTNIEGGTTAGDSWIELDTRFDNLEVVSQSAQKVVLKATGVYHHDLANNPEAKEGEVEQIITVESGKPYAQIETSIKNTSGQKLDLYVGDAMDVDMGTQKSYAPGIGDITAAYNSPIDEKPSQPWFSQYASAQQEIYSFLYEDTFDFNVFGSSNWLMGYTPVSLEDGESFSYNRKMVVLDTEGYEQAPEAMNAYYNAQEYGLDASMEVYEGEIEKGDIFPVKITINNASDQPVKNAEVSLDTPYQMMSIDGDSITVPEIPANSSKTVEFSVLALEGGRGSLKSKLNAGEDISISFSKALSIGGEGHYSGDNHTHSTNSDGSGTIRQNVDSAYEDKMVNWLYSTDHNQNSQKGETVTETQRLEGKFINISGTEITSSGKGHALAYGVDFVPEYRIGQTLNGETWTWQDTIDQVTDAGGIFYVAHPNYPGLKFSDPYGIKNYSGIEVWNGFYHALDADKNVNTFAFEYWDNVNRIGERKYFGIANSDGHNPGKMADPYIKTEMDLLTYDNIQEVLKNGNYYGSNGPELRYNIEGVGMGETLNIQENRKAEFNITAFDQNYDLKNVKLIKNTVTGSASDGSQKEIVFEEDLSGKGIKEFQKTISLEVKPNEFYRIEVISEKGTTGNGGKGEGQGLGFAFSNPIWIGEAAKSNAKDIEEIEYSDGQVIQTIGENTVIRTNGDFSLDKLSVKVSDGATVNTELVSGQQDVLESSSAVNIVVTAEDGSKDTETVFLLSGEDSNEDTQKPQINVGEVPSAGSVGEEVKLPEAAATDNTDGEVPVSVAVTGPNGESVTVTNHTFVPETEGSYTVTYTASDKAGNKEELIFSISVSAKTEADTEKPQITIDGEVPKTGIVNTAIKLPGATAADNIDGQVPVEIAVLNPDGDKVSLDSNTFVPKTAGNYTVTYTASDKAGNEVSQIFSVQIANEKADNETSDNQNQNPQTGDTMIPIAIAGLVAAFSGAVLTVLNKIKGKHKKS